jgi:hypothetical protein
MGSGSSRSKVKKIDKSNQMPPISETKLYRSPSPSKSPLFKRVLPKPNKRRSSIQDNTFELNNNIEEYSSIWDDDTKVNYYIFR